MLYDVGCTTYDKENVVPRLFVSTREINFLADITKELLNDVMGITLDYFPINELKTKAHEIYNESNSKQFDNPIRISAVVDSSQAPTKIDKFGADAQWKIEVYIQNRDLIDRGINASIGDMFQFSDVFYEVTERAFMKNSFGLPEYRNTVHLTGTKARETQFKALLQGPTDERYTDDNAVQKTFVQQRGFEENSQGKTGDVRALVRDGVLELPVEGPREVSSRGTDIDKGSSFYDE